MKEDIEILEHIAIAYKDDETVNKSLANIVTCNLITNGELAKAIENLIKAYKELEERNHYLVQERQQYEEMLFKSKEHYIEKDKIREKLDEAIEKYAEEKSALIQIATKGVILALQELLEEE